MAVQQLIKRLSISLCLTCISTGLLASPAKLSTVKELMQVSQIDYLMRQSLTELEPYYNKQAENSEYIKNKEYRNNMNEFKFYGEENTENDDAVQLREQQAEKEAEKERKYKKHSVLDNTALFLFIVLIAENTILFATRIFFQEEMYAKAMPFFM